MTTDSTMTTETTETTTKNRKAKRPAVKAPPKLTLEAAQKFCNQQVRSKKGNAAMFKFIATQLGDLDGLQKAIMRGFGETILESVQANLNEIRL